jgi:hypothetical protein
MQALRIYQDLLKQDDPDPVYYTYSAACNYYMGIYQEAKQLALKASWQLIVTCDCTVHHSWHRCSKLKSSDD